MSRFQRLLKAGMVALAAILLTGCGTVTLRGIGDRVCDQIEAGARTSRAGITGASESIILLNLPPATPKNAEEATAQGLIDLELEAVGTLIPWADAYRGMKSLPQRQVLEAERASGQVRELIALVNARPDEDLPFPVKVQAAWVSEIERTLARGGYEALALKKLGSRRLDAEFDVGRIMATYFRAYFRGGKPFQVSLAKDALARQLASKVADTIKLGESQKDQAQGAITEALGDLCRVDAGPDKPCLLTARLGEEAFVTRAGLSVQFAGITAAVGEGGQARIGVTHPKGEEVAPQIVRVIVEALFDAHQPIVPAAGDSTACVANIFPADKCLAAVTAAARSEELTPADKVAWVDEQASKSEAFVTSAAGKVARGASWLALNNEALAKSFETLLGVTARKWVEKEAWDLAKDCTAVPGRVLVDVR